MQLARLLSDLPDARISGNPVVDITDIAYDSRRVRPGALFMAIPTVGGDAWSGGFQYLDAALEAGAAAVLAQGDLPALPVPVVHVPDARLAMAQVAAAYFAYPSRDMRLFAVTGTDGKTTTTYWLEGIFAGLGYTTGLLGTVENKIGNRREAHPERMTTPESADVQRLLREMVGAGVTHAALEASSHALALDRLAGCTFAGKAYTNITGDHVEFHGSMEEYVRAKSRLFSDLSPDAPAVLNRDDVYCARLQAFTQGRVITYSVGGEADLRAAEVELGAEESVCTLHYGGESARLRVPLPGRYNISNALAAAGLALCDRHPLDAIAAALSEAPPPPGRWQRVEVGQAFRVIVDYAHTTAAFELVLQAARARTEGRVIVVFGAAGNRDRGKRPILATIARRLADFSIITNEDPYGEEAEAIVAEIEAGMPRAEKGHRYLTVLDRGAAIQTALNQARPGDTVLILGKGHERSIMDGGRRSDWNDADMVRAALGAAR